MSKQREEERQQQEAIEKIIQEFKGIGKPDAQIEFLSQFDEDTLEALQ